MRTRIKDNHLGIIIFLAGLLAIFGLTAYQLTARGAEDATAAKTAFQPLAIANSSLNGNAIWGATENWSVIQQSGGLDDWAAFFDASRSDRYAGLPSSGGMKINGVPYSFKWTGQDSYDGNDTIRLYSGHTTETVNLETIGVYKQIYVLSTAGGPGAGHYANFDVTLHYTDGTSDDTYYRIYDWFDSTPVSGVYKYSGIKRRELSGGNYGGTGSESKYPLLQSATISVDSTKLLKSIDLTLTGKDGSSRTSGIFTGVFAITGMVDVSAPEPPVALPATDITKESFLAHWNLVDKATSYRLDVATDENFTNILPAYNNLSVNSSSLAIMGLNKNTTYYYRIRAVNDNGQSLSSNIIEATTLNLDETAPVISISADQTTIKTSDTLVITSTDNAALGNIEFSSDSGPHWEDLAHTDTAPTLSTSKEITHNGTYLVRSTDLAGNQSATTSVVYANIDSVKPDVIVNTNGYTEGAWTNAPVVLTPTTSTNNLGTTTYYYSTGATDWQPVNQSVIVNAEGESTYYFKAHSAAGLESEPKAVTVKRDTTLPTGTISGSGNEWNTLMNRITFGLFFNETQNYTITAEDSDSGIAEIKYLFSKDAYDAADDALRADGWRSTSNGGTVSVDPELDFTLYYAITDNAGNTTVINTDGIVLDTTKALIEGYALGTTYPLENGQTYYLANAIVVTDNKALAEVKINDIPVDFSANGIIALDKGVNNIIATDKAGNITTLTLNAGNLSDLWNLDLDHATSDDVTAINSALNELSAVVFNEGDHATADETSLINTASTRMTDTLDLLRDIAEQIATIDSDYTALPNIDHTNSNFKGAVESLITRIENLLDEEDAHLTPAEKQHLEELLASLKSTDDRIIEVSDEYSDINSSSDKYSPDTSTTEDLSDIEDLISRIDTLLETDNLTAEERSELETLKTTLSAIEDKIHAAEQALEGALNNDQTLGAQDLPSVTTQTVQESDRPRLESALNGYAGVLGAYASNLSLADNLALTGRVASINSMIDMLDGMGIYINDSPASFAYETLDVLFWVFILLLVLGLAVVFFLVLRSKRLEHAATARRAAAEDQEKPAPEGTTEKALDKTDKV